MQLDSGRIGGATDETGEQNRVFRRAAGKKRRIPHGAQNAKIFTARYQETKTIQRPGYMFAAVAQSHHGYGSVGNLGEKLSAASGDRRGDSSCDRSGNG